MGVVLGPIGELKGGGDIFLQAGGQQGEGPLLVLHKGGNAAVGLRPEVGADGGVVDGAALRDELYVNLFMAVAELERGARAKPVTAPGLDAGSIAAHPIAHQELAVGVEVAVEIVPINILAGSIVRDGVG